MDHDDVLYEENIYIDESPPLTPRRPGRSCAFAPRGCCSPSGWFCVLVTWIFVLTALTVGVIALVEVNAHRHDKDIHSSIKSYTVASNGPCTATVAPWTGDLVAVHHSCQAPGYTFAGTTFARDFVCVNSDSGYTCIS